MWRPKPKSPTKPIDIMGTGVGVGVGEAEMRVTERGMGLAGFFECKMKYNIRDRMTRTNKMISLGIVLLCGLFLGACGGDSRSGLEITSEPIAKVYINGVDSGSTKYKNTKLKSGETEIKLITETGESWERRINLEKNVTTVISWDLKENSGYILSMEKSGKKASMLINSNPGNAIISLQGDIKNRSPANLENLEIDDYKVSLNFPGYESLNLIVKTVDKYQLIIDAKLATEKIPLNQITPTTTQINPIIEKIKIKDTPTGWLRIRETPNNNGQEIGRANVGETYELLGIEGEWYHIVYKERQGFISVKYAEKVLE